MKQFIENSHFERAFLLARNLRTRFSMAVYNAILPAFLSGTCTPLASSKTFQIQKIFEEKSGSIFQFKGCSSKFLQQLSILETQKEKTRQQWIKGQQFMWKLTLNNSRTPRLFSRFESLQISRPCSIIVYWVYVQWIDYLSPINLIPKWVELSKVARVDSVVSMDNVFWHLRVVWYN